jgi:ketopantoate reductase
LFETPNHAELLEKTGARAMITGIIDELLVLAQSQGCVFPENIHEQTMEAMIQPTPTPSTMYQDFTARRPLEIETFLGAPIKLAQDMGVPVPRIETLYALLHNANTLNQSQQLQSHHRTLHKPPAWLPAQIWALVPTWVLALISVVQ